MQDKASATDYVEAGLHTAVVPHDYPCPKCKKAMKDHNTDEDREAGKEVRICSNRSCRAIVEWSTGKPVFQKAK